MGVLSVTAPQSLINRLDKIVRTSGLPEKMLNAAMDVMEPELKRRLAPHDKSGELMKSVTKGDPDVDSKGVWRSDIYFDGYDTSREATASDPRGIPNDRKMMSMEWGTSRQVATPVIRPTKEAKNSEAVAAMQAVFDKEVK